MRKLFIFFAFSILLACGSNTPVANNDFIKIVRDWHEIKEDSVLTILAENSPASYFIYRGKNMGFEYELLSEFAKDQNIRLKVTMVHNLDDLMHYLDSGVGDVIACNLTVTEERSTLIDFTTPHLFTHQVLIQRKPENYRKLSFSALQDSLVTELEQLKGKTIHVWKNSSYYNQIRYLNDQLELQLTIIPTDGDLITEELIRMVSEGEIDYTIADENIAKIDLRYYPNLDISLALSSEESIAFGVRKTSPQLKAQLNKWLTAKENQSTIGEVKRKYFERKNLSNKANQDYSSLSGDELSPYDAIIKRESDKIGWDWRLVASIIYQESKFETYKESWAGAFGIFQFMPNTAASYGISPTSSAEEQIVAGIEKLNKNYKEWLTEINDTSECIKFTLATFNAGRAHVDDARALCSVNNLNHCQWENNVGDMIKNLSKPTYYQNSVVKNGYCRGSETYEYVIEVMERYEEYKSAFPNLPNSDQANR